MLQSFNIKPFLCGFLGVLINTGLSAAYEAPIVQAHGVAPGCMAVSWVHSTSGVSYFQLSREQPLTTWNISPSQLNFTDCGLNPDTPYRYLVCAFFVTVDGAYQCSELSATARTLPAATPQQNPGAPPTPRIVRHDTGDTWIGVKWEAGFNYHSYFLNTTEVPPDGTLRAPKTIHHDDDGTWGYQRVDGLIPGQTYRFQVQGCRERVFGILDDNCYGWSAPYEATTLAPTLPPPSPTEKGRSLEPIFYLILQN